MEIGNGAKPKEGEHFLNIEGPKGASLFYRPITWIFAPDFDLVSKQFIRYKEFIEQSKEQRLTSIVAALCVEEALDLCLEAYIPKYKDELQTNPAFTFFWKIKLAISLNLFPQHILKAAELINKIRNKFVHNLEVENFNSIYDKFNERLKRTYSEFSPEIDPKKLSSKDMFVEIAEYIIVGLGIYSSHIKAAKKYIHSSDFMKHLEGRLKSEGTDIWTKLTTKKKSP